jgi:GT2 family glycosyltransferase
MIAQQPMAERPQVSVVTTAWNHSYLLKGFVESFERVTAPASAERNEIVVVDNGSVDDTARYLEGWRAAPGGARWKTVLTSDSNRGFAAGANLGLRTARGEHILIVNNDVLFDADPIAFCLKAYRRGPRAILGRKLIDRAGPWNTLDGRAVRYLEGWFLFASADVFREIGIWGDGAFLGVFDETFSPAFYEDIDLSLRAAAAGIDLREVRAPVRHLESRTTKMTDGFDYMDVIRENQRRFQEKWRDRVPPAAATAGPEGPWARALRGLAASRRGGE